MTPLEYEHLQDELSHLLKTEKYKWMASREKEGFKNGVLACKSVLSNYGERKLRLIDESRNNSNRQ